MFVRVMDCLIIFSLITWLNISKPDAYMYIFTLTDLIVTSILCL